MRYVTLFLALTMLVLMPAAVSAQEPPPRPPSIELLPPRPCSFDCWWPVGSVARLDVLEAKVEVGDGVMVARYRFLLSNPSSPYENFPHSDAEGRIVFPVPPGSSITDLVLSGGSETLEGRVLDAAEAARIYEEIVRRLIDPALLRSLGDDLYEVRAFPVPAGEKREVSFTVTTPMLAEGEQVLVSIPWSQMSPRPVSAVVSVDIDVPWEVRSTLAPGFDLDAKRIAPGRLELSWESAEGWIPSANFRLYLGGGEGLVDARLLVHRMAGEDGYFALLFAPMVDVDAVVPRDIVLVLDTSGSMTGEKLTQAVAAAEFVLDHLGNEDRFAIVSFARSVRTFRFAPSSASEAAAGITYLKSLDAGGGTNISGALERALHFLDGSRPGTVIFLTDGLPTAGIEDRAGILRVAERAAADHTQLFAFGVGYNVDTVLLDALSSRFVGSSHYVMPEERIDTEVQRLFMRVSTPVLTDVEVRINGLDTWDLAPTEIPGIFAGNQALLTGRYGGSGEATIVVTGNSVLGTERFAYEVHFPRRDGSEPAIAQLWAQRRVAALLTELRIEGRRESLIEEIVEIATRFGIVTPFTSYLAEEPKLAFHHEAAMRAVDAAAAAAPASGKSAVGNASDIEELRAGGFDLGGQNVRILGAHSYYLLDDSWARDGYKPGSEAPEVVVGSAAFAALIESAHELAGASALGERVIVLGPDGWITIVWPDAEDAETPSTVPNLPTSGPTFMHPDAGGTGSTRPANVSDPPAPIDDIDGGVANGMHATVGSAIVLGSVATVAWRWLHRYAA